MFKVRCNYPDFVSKLQKGEIYDITTTDTESCGYCHKDKCIGFMINEVIYCNRRFTKITILEYV